jgi:hypothetical protein
VAETFWMFETNKDISLFMGKMGKSKLKGLAQQIAELDGPAPEGMFGLSSFKWGKFLTCCRL